MHFLFFLMCWNTYIYSVFWTSTKIWQKGGKKNDNFSHFPKHRFIKKTRFVATPLWPKIGVFQLCFLKPQTLMLNKKTELKISKKQRKEKGIGKKSKTGNQKKEKIFQEKNKLKLIFFSCCVLFMKQKQRRKKMKKRQKQETKRKQKERQKGRKKDKRKRETEKEKQKKGEAKKG